MTPPDRISHRLAGCRPEPLGSYLKALGTLRVVGEQADSSARGRWAGDGFVLETALDEESLHAFLLDQYQPMPVVSPWNKSSGFGREGTGELADIESSTDPRLAPYRQAIGAARQVMSDPRWASWDKETRVAACRSRLPDACLAWIDTAVVLTDDRAVYPPILGTGGNDGRLEFSRNYHQRVLDVLGLRSSTSDRRGGWLTQALDGLGDNALLRDRSSGQFDGGSSVLNPWDWVLLIEGAVLFASGSARRLAADSKGRAAAPFTVDRTTAGYASASADERDRGELWLPLWERPTPLGELRRFFAEARADWRGRHARSGGDLARAAANLGVDRGLSGFSRHALLERNGLATMATPVGRIRVVERPAVRLLAELDRWLDSVRRARDLPATALRALTAVDRRAFELAAGRGAASEVLQAASALDGQLVRSDRPPEHVDPLSLPADRWAPVLLDADDSAELRLALSLASTRDGGSERRMSGGLRALLRARWEGSTLHSAAVQGSGRRGATSLLAEAHTRRVVDLVRSERLLEQQGQPGVPTRFAHGTAGPLADVAALVRGELDDRRLSELLEAAMVLDYRERISWPTHPEMGFVPPALGIVGPFYAPQPSSGRVSTEGRWADRLWSTWLCPEATWPALLAAGRLGVVVDAALRRLRIAGLCPVMERGGSGLGSDRDSAEARRLAAALLVPLTRSDRMQLLGCCCPDPDLSQRHDPQGEPHRAQP